MLVRGLLLALLFLVGCSSAKVVRKSPDPRLDKALTEAESLLGTAYCPGGETPSCFDCSGLIFHCFYKGGVELPRVSREMASVGAAVPVKDLEPGDLVFFRTQGKNISHVGMYFGNNTFIHSSTSNGVIVSSLSDAYWKPRFVCARRINR